MGYLIRHIHNRDLAGENIVTAYVRLRFILKNYPTTQLNLVQRLDAMDIQMPRGGWTLQLADEILKLKGSLPGQYKCVVMPSRRNSRKVVWVHAPADLLPKLRAVWRPHGRPPALAENICKMMVKGVSLNGRKYKQGDRVSYLGRVRRRGNVEGPGGHEGSSTSHKIGTIKMFYHFPALVNGCSTTFVDILEIPVLRKWRSLFIVPTQPSLPRGFQCNAAVTRQSTIYHVDVITAKVMLAPNYTEDEEEATTEMCALTMWEAR